MSVLNESAATVQPAVGVKAPAVSALASYVTEFLNRPETGGLPGLTKKFETAGLGAQMKSWTSGGKPLPITPDQVTLALGSTEIAAMATKTGIPASEVAEQLTTILPDVVSHLTPGGRVPSAAKVGEPVGSLEEKVIK